MSLRKTFSPCLYVKLQNKNTLIYSNKKVQIPVYHFYLALVLNPFMLNVFSHPYQLDEFISNFRVIGWYFSFYSHFQKNFCK